MKTCDDIINDFKLKVGHCHSCHDELTEGFQDPQPIFIDGVKYDTPCCIVALELNAIGIEVKYS